MTLTMALGLCPATGIAEELVDVGPDDAVAVVQGQGVETLSEEEPAVQVQNAVNYGVWVGAGTTGLAKRVEAIEVQILPQGQVPNGYDASKAAAIGS